MVFQHPYIKVVHGHDLVAKEKTKNMHVERRLEGEKQLLEIEAISSAMLLCVSQTIVCYGGCMCVLLPEAHCRCHFPKGGLAALAHDVWRVALVEKRGWMRPSQQC
eukprot:1113119-Amphidinium_carterae.1